MQIKDARLLPITRQELERLVQTTPPSSGRHAELISRAYVSGLSKEAYELYTILWKKRPDNSYTNLCRGDAAESYWVYVTRSKANRTPPSRFASLRKAALDGLSKAAELDSENSIAQAKYGHFLWQYQGRWKEGASHINKALSLNPKSTYAYAQLGDLLSNPTPGSGYYNPKKALEQLRTAVRLDPSYAYPHYLMARTYLLLKQYPEAQRELKAYLRLAPQQMMQEPWVKFMQSQINQGLGNP